MSSSVAAYRPRPRAPAVGIADTSERSVRWRVGLAWNLLFLNTLTFYPGTWTGQHLVLPIPHRVGELITQGALPAALLMVLTVNRRLLIRPNVFLCLLSLLIVGALVSALGHQGGQLGTMYRTVRFAGFVVTLWLLTPWWGRRDMLLLKCQMIAMSTALGGVILGLILAPHRALAQGRLAGTIWPTPPTQVADFAAATLGLVIVFWLSGLMRGRLTLAATALLMAGLLMTHSRTELIAMVAGILIAGVSLFASKARVRRFFAGISIAAAGAIVLFSGVLASWLARGQEGHLTTLTGRTTVWTAVIHEQRDVFQVVFGFGLSNESFNGLPIDSSWFAAYFDFGLLGVLACAAMVLFVVTTACFQPRSPQRALAIFLVTYLIVRSFTETGLSLATANLLDLTIAASLLVPLRHQAVLS
ncbi:MAG TPA: hypothetical protein VKU39_03130 [Streptosporangiaceae bacterium]|nr:hypothetical protein [Streptosporangiaceae bacterium]